MRKLLAVSFILFVTILRVTAANEYKLIKEIPINGEGGWDYLSIDAKARHLYVTHADKVVVVDLNNDTIAGKISDTPGVHGFAIAPELGRGFSSNGKENKSSIVDLKTLKTISKVETGENPDAILFEPGQQEVYTFNGRGRSATVFGDARTIAPGAARPVRILAPTFERRQNRDRTGFSHQHHPRGANQCALPAVHGRLAGSALEELTADRPLLYR